jgi:hypothetical protein
LHPKDPNLHYFPEGRVVAQLDFPKEMPIRHWGQEGLSPVACKQFGFATYFAFAISLQKKQ